MAEAMSPDPFDTSDIPTPIPAATLVIFRHDPDGGAPQLLMVERSNTMRFAGGAAVFPGGRIDDSDRTLAAQLGAGELEEIEAVAAKVAAIRETLEETGLAVGLHQRPTLDQARTARAHLLEAGALAPVLEAMGWVLNLDALAYFARWCPKHREIRVFDTRFFLADLGTGAVDLLVDATENTHLFWVSAGEALELADQDKIKVIFPTRRNLERLAQFGSFGEALDHLAATPVQTISPWREDRDGEAWLCIPGDAGYPIDGEPLTNAIRA